MIIDPELPPRLEKQCKELRCEIEGPRDTNTIYAAGAFASLNVDNSFDLLKFKERCKIKIQEFNDHRVIFDLSGVDVSIANAIRRILIADVPTVAIETVHIWQNTGVIQDEVLAHRLGLIPFKIAPDALDYRKENEDLTDDNALKFRLHVKCTPADIPPNQTSMPVYASHMTWVPMSKKQQQRFQDAVPGPVEPTIVITRLRPGQEIEAELFCEKGIGKTHAKWSPVATAVYRLLPSFKFPTGPLKGAEANELVEICPTNVFDVEDGCAFAARPRQCTTCRACLERFPDKVKLNKIKDHFIFTLESTGSVPAATLFRQAINILQEKASKIKENLQTILCEGLEEEDEC